MSVYPLISKQWSCKEMGRAHWWDEESWFSTGTELQAVPFNFPAGPKPLAEPSWEGFPCHPALPEDYSPGSSGIRFYDFLHILGILQNCRMAEVGGDFRSPSLTPCRAGSPRAHCTGWCPEGGWISRGDPTAPLGSLSWCCHPHSTELSPQIEQEPPGFHFMPVASHPVAGATWKPPPATLPSDTR